MSEDLLYRAVIRRFRRRRRRTGVLRRPRIGRLCRPPGSFAASTRSPWRRPAGGREKRALRRPGPGFLPFVYLLPRLLLRSVVTERWLALTARMRLTIRGGSAKMPHRSAPPWDPRHSPSAATVAGVFARSRLVKAAFLRRRLPRGGAVGRIQPGPVPPAPIRTRVERSRPPRTLTEPGRLRRRRQGSPGFHLPPPAAGRSFPSRSAGRPAPRPSILPGRGRSSVERAGRRPTGAPAATASQRSAQRRFSDPWVDPSSQRRSISPRSSYPLPSPGNRPPGSPGVELGFSAGVLRSPRRMRDRRPRVLRYAADHRARGATTGVPGSSPRLGNRLPGAGTLYVHRRLAHHRRARGATTGVPGSSRRLANRLPGVLRLAHHRRARDAKTGVPGSSRRLANRLPGVLRLTADRRVYGSTTGVSRTRPKRLRAAAAIQPPAGRRADPRRPPSGPPARRDPVIARVQQAPRRAPEPAGALYVHRRATMESPQRAAEPGRSPGAVPDGASRQATAREVEALVRHNLERWQRKALNPKRIARQAQQSMVRQLVRERERLGR